MSEYVIVEAEATPDPDVMILHVNQALTEADEEVYPSAEAAEAGSAIAQMLFFDLDGIRSAVIQPTRLILTRTSDAEWTALVDDVRDALRDFFL